MDLTVLLHGAYVVTAVFGFGVMAVDLMGLLGHHDGGNGDHAHGADGHHLSGDLEADLHGSHGAHFSLLMLLSRVRLAVYFAAGFGGLGLAAEFTGTGAVSGLMWAVGGGVLTTLLARAVFRFQTRDVDSSLAEAELLAQQARVIVPLSASDMGKIRVGIGQLTIERYALSDDANESFGVDATVEIVRTTDECVYVRAID